MGFTFPIVGQAVKKFNNYIEGKVFQREPIDEEKFGTDAEYLKSAMAMALEIQDEHLKELIGKWNPKKFRNEYYSNSLLKSAIDWRAYVLSDFKVETTSDKVKTAVCDFASKIRGTDILDYDVAVKVLNALIREVSINDDIQGYNLGLITIEKESKYRIGFFSFLDGTFKISKDRKYITIPQYFYTNIKEDGTYTFEVIDKKDIPTSHFLWYSSNGSYFNLLNVSKIRAAIEPAYYYSKILSYGAKAFGILANTPLHGKKKNLSATGVPGKITPTEKLQKAKELSAIREGKMNVLIDTDEWEYKNLEVFSIAQTNLSNFAEEYVNAVANAFREPKELLNAERKDVNKSLIPAIQTWSDTSIKGDRTNMEIFIYQLLNRVMIEANIIPSDRRFTIKWSNFMQAVAAPTIPVISKNETKNIVEKETTGPNGLPVTYKTEDKKTITQPVSTFQNQK